VITAIQQTGRSLWSRVRGGRGIGERLRDDVIEPIGEGLRAGGEAASERVRRSNGHVGLSAPVLVAAGVAGAVGEYFLDPRSGRRRRAAARDRIAAVLRRRKADAERQTRYAAAVAKGTVERATPSDRRPDELNDAALEAKVESELFRDADAPKSKVNVSVEEGVVYLRGELRTKKAIEGLGRSARAVEGVGEVVNLLHRPGEEAPSKADGHRRGGAKRASGKTRGKAKRQAPARSK
jgi:hypothetical protein